MALKYIHFHFAVALETMGSTYRKPAFQPSAFRRLFIGFKPSAENQPISMEKALDLKFLQVFFKNRGGNFSFLKNVEFLEVFGFTLCFRTFQANFFFKNFQTDRKISSPNHVVYP